MNHFIVIENDNGLQVATVGKEQSNEDVAVENQGWIVDAGPYRTFDDAYDAMQLIPGIKRDVSSDRPI